MVVWLYAAAQIILPIYCVLTGTIDTPYNQSSMPNADYSRWVIQVEIADIILFLTSYAGLAATGAIIPVFLW